MNVFIIGAGFTKAVFPNAPLNRDLIETLAGRFSDSKCLELRDRYNTKDIEIGLTRLDAELAMLQWKSGQLYEDLLKLRQGIEHELADYFHSFRVTEDFCERSRWLSHFVDKGFSTKDVVISLNYDCVLEGTLDCRRKWSANGGYGAVVNHLAISKRTPKSPVTVLKIHGSANFIAAPYVDKPATSAISYIFDEYFFPRSGKYAHIGFGAGTGKSYIVAPSYVKIPAVEITYLMIDALAASTKAKNLVVIGSALRPEDGFLTVVMTNFLRQRYWPNRKIIILDPAAEAIKNRVELYWGVDVSKQIVTIEGLLEDSVALILDEISLKK